MTYEKTVIYCDGACSGNPGPGGWGSIVATPDGQVRELGAGAARTTNNQMELLAATQALRLVADLTLSLTNGGGASAGAGRSAAANELIVYTDSVYVIKGITQWIWGWMKRGWKTAEGKDVLNKDYWQALAASVAELKGSHKISWKYVRGHTGIEGNERCDEIAVAYSKNTSVRLFSGPVESYHFHVYDLPTDEGLPDGGGTGSKKGPKAPAHSYLSYLGGTAIRHKTWTECERRVKGQPGAKFKKATSASNEAEILKSWGLPTSAVKESG